MQEPVHVMHGNTTDAQAAAVHNNYMAVKLGSDITPDFFRYMQPQLRQIQPCNEDTFTNPVVQVVLSGWLNERLPWMSNWMIVLPTKDWRVYVLAGRLSEAFEWTQSAAGKKMNARLKIESLPKDRIVNYVARDHKRCLGLVCVQKCEGSEPSTPHTAGTRKRRNVLGDDDDD